MEQATPLSSQQLFQAMTDKSFERMLNTYAQGFDPFRHRMQSYHNINFMLSYFKSYQEHKIEQNTALCMLLSYLKLFLNNIYHELQHNQKGADSNAKCN